jgi:hypothetical protein
VSAGAARYIETESGKVRESQKQSGTVKPEGDRVVKSRGIVRESQRMSGKVRDSQEQ